MTFALGIDHPLVLVRDIEAMAAKYRALGFNTAPTGRHPWGTSTSLIMFDRQALELMGVYDDTLLDSHAVGDFRFGRHMADALAEREGVSLVAFTAKMPRETETASRNAASPPRAGSTSDARLRSPAGAGTRQWSPWRSWWIPKCRARPTSSASSTGPI